MTVQCRGAWLKTNLLLSKARKMRLNINCVGSLNEHRSLRLFLKIHLSHRKKEIFLFGGGIRSISDLTFKIYRREKYSIYK